MNRTFNKFNTDYELRAKELYGNALKSVSKTCLKALSYEKLVKSSVGFQEKFKSQLKYSHAIRKAKRKINDFMQTSLRCGVVPYNYEKTCALLLEVEDKEQRLIFYNDIAEQCIKEQQVVGPINLEMLYQVSLEQ